MAGSEDEDAALDSLASLPPVVYPVQQQLRPGEECVVCLEAPKEYAMTPCGHLAMCTNCVRGAAVRCLRKCPVCRSPLAAPWAQRVFR